MSVWGFRMSGAMFRVWGSGFRVQGLGKKFSVPSEASPLWR